MLPSTVQRQIDDMVGTINLIAERLTVMRLEVDALEKERDRLLLEWWKLEQQHVVKVPYQYAHRQRHTPRPLTHEEVMIQAKQRFEAKHKKAVNRIATDKETGKVNEAIAGILSDLFPA